MRIFGLVTLLVASVLLTVGCGGNTAPKEGNTDGGGGGGSTTIERPKEIPAPFGGMESPFKTPEEKAAAAKAGMNNFIGTCANCHGDMGKGDGPGGATLNPKPSDFTAAAVQAMGDDYFFWRITKGATVEPFKSAKSGMSPYESQFSEEQRWQIVEYIRTLAGE